MAAAGLRAWRITSRRRLSVRAPLLSSDTGIATAARLDRWAIRRFSLSRRGVFPSDNTGLVMAAAGLRGLRITSRHRLSLRAPVLSNGARVAVVTAGLLDLWAIRSFGLSRHGVLPSDNAGLVLAAAGLRARRITSRRRLSLRAPLLSNGTGIATAARLDRWAIRSFSLSRRGVFPSAAAGVAIATAGRHGLRVVPARPLRR
jgi:hypothetical protein